MGGDLELDQLADSGPAVEGDLGEIGRAGPPLALDQRLEAPANLAAQMAAERGIASGSQLRSALLDLTRRHLRHPRGRRPGSRAVGEDVQVGEAGGGDERNGVFERGVSFGWKAGDEVGADHERLRQALGPRLGGIADRQSQPRSVAQQPFEQR